MQRSAGILLHVTSLPGPFACGNLGPAAKHWIDLLAEAGLTWWQVLPLVPPGTGLGPYAGSSAFAGNPWLISPEVLHAEGLLDRSDLSQAKSKEGRVDLRRLARTYDVLLRKAWENFHRKPQKFADDFNQFRSREASWLNDYALFAALKESTHGKSWTEWPDEIVRRNPAALQSAANELKDSIDRHCFVQFLFDRQISALRQYAKQRGVKLIGDIPIFVSFESADVWTHAHQFRLDRHFHPKVVTGVPPDYFSATGQRWGNPHYDWRAMEKDNYAWWTARIRQTLRQVDVIRLDHFRGFQASWEIPASCPTAVEGKWVPGPGKKLFKVFHDVFGDLPFIAEDLGLITPSVEKLRDDLHLPGMRVLQFAFGNDSHNPFLPHNHPRNAVAYTGTHDNDTTVGWFKSLKPTEKKRVDSYAPDARRDPAGALLRLAWSSVADLAIAPLQDVLRLDSEARMNTPAVAQGNWAWRATAKQFSPQALDEIADLTKLYARTKN